MKAYSADLRQRVLDACDRGETTSDVARRYGVSRAWVRRLKQFRRELGIITPRPINGHRPRAFDRDRLQELVDEKPDRTLRELRELLGVECSLGAICNALRGMRLSYKKSP